MSRWEGAGRHPWPRRSRWRSARWARGPLSSAAATGGVRAAFGSWRTAAAARGATGGLFRGAPPREPLSALKRAGLVVVTNPPTTAVVSDIAHMLRRTGSAAAVISGAYHPTSLRRGDHGRADAPEALRGRKVLALAGLAAPRGLVTTAEGLGAEVAGLAEFPDHYWYTAGDLARVAALARETGAEAILTTEKDWVRLREMARGDLPFWVLSVRLDMGADRAALVQALTETLRRGAVGRRMP